MSFEGQKTPPSPLDLLSVVLFRPKLPENVGAVARACVNMGFSRLVLVKPREWDVRRAEPMATHKGAPVLWDALIHSDMKEALAPFHMVFGTTARTGGWRKGILSPEQAAERISGLLLSGQQAAVVFGPEDFGLTNQEIEICGPLISIPTSKEASSLNLAQAVLIILYECFKRVREAETAAEPVSDTISWEDRMRLFATIQKSLLSMDFIKKDNPDYWMLPVKRFLNKSPLHRNEYNILMGFCRQIDWLAKQAFAHEDKH